MLQKNDLNAIKAIKNMKKNIKGTLMQIWKSPCIFLFL